MVEQENAKEHEVRQALEARLDSNETLIAYTTGNITSGIAFTMLQASAPYHIGLTPKRLILLSPNPTGQTFSIGREKIKSLKFNQTGLFSSRLIVRLPKDTFSLNIKGGNWRKRAKELAAEASVEFTMLSSITATRQGVVQQAQDFQELGFVASAQYLLNEATQNDPALAMEPTAQALRKQLAEVRLASRVGAGFFFINDAVVILFALLSVLLGQGLAGVINFEQAIFLLVAFAIGIRLWGGRSEWRGYAVVVAAFSFLYDVLSVFTDGNFVGLITGVGFSGAVVLVLTGKSSRKRTLLALGTYTIAYLSVTVLTILAFLFSYFWYSNALSIKADHPDTVQMGDSFELVLHLENKSETDVVVGDIDLGPGIEGEHSILEGTTINKTDPVMESEEFPSLKLRSYKYNRTVKSGETQTVAFYLQTIQSGEFHTSVDVYANDRPGTLFDFGITITP